MAKSNSTPRIRSLGELLVEGTQGNPCSASSSSKLGAEVVSTSTSSTSGETSSSSDSSSRCSSSEGASTSSSSQEGHLAPGKSVHKRKDRSPVGLVPEIFAEGLEFLGTLTCSNSQDGLGSHFPNPKVVPTLKRMTLEKQYLLPGGYIFVISEADASVNEPPNKCIAVYHATLNYVSNFLFTQ